MRISHIIFLLGFNMTTTFAHSATDTLEQQKHVINGHRLETVVPGVSKEDIIAKRTEMMTALMSLIDHAFTFYGGISLNLADTPFDPDTTDREVFRKALKDSMSTLQDPAAIVVGLEEMDFYQSLTKNIENDIKYLETTEDEIENKLEIINALKIRLEKEKLTRDALAKFMCISATEDFDMGLKLFRHATINKNTIAAQHFLSTHLSPDWISWPWNELSEQDQMEIQALNDCGNVQFQYLRAYKIYTDATLTLAEKMERLDALETEAGRDFAHVIKFNALKASIAEENKENATLKWMAYIETATTLPLSCRIAFTPLENSRDSMTWPKGYETALYNIARKHTSEISAESSRLDLLKVLTDHFQIVEIANHYFSEFLVLNPETSALSNEEKIVEIKRIAAFIPAAKHVLATAIATPPVDSSDSSFNNQITLGYHKKTHAERLHALYELSNGGEREATKYLAEAYRDAILTESTSPLASHLGIPIRSSLSESERTFGNIAEQHKNNTIALIRLAFNLDDTAQSSLFAKPEDGGFSIMEKLFDYRLAQANLPCGSDQTTMNRMLMDLLQYGFHVANSLKELHSIPDFFREQVQASLMTDSNA